MDKCESKMLNAVVVMMQIHLAKKKCHGRKIGHSDQPTMATDGQTDEPMEGPPNLCAPANRD